MSTKNGLVRIFTGRKVIIERIVTELELNGIISIVKNEFQQGIEAGFVGGAPTAIDLFVTETDAENAREIIKSIIEE
jgi:hypothetical protein